MGWNWTELHQLVNLTDMVKLASVSIDSVSQERDEVVWRTKRATLFSVKSTYELASRWAKGELWEGW